MITQEELDKLLLEAAEAKRESAEAYKAVAVKAAKHLKALREASERLHAALHRTGINPQVQE